MIGKAMSQVDFVFHQAAIASVDLSLKYPQKAVKTNLIGLLNVLEESRNNKVRKIVFASSASVYGPSKKRKIESETFKPLSLYAMTKMAGEELCRFFSQKYKVPTISLRYFNVFGPGQNPQSEYAAVIPRFILSLLYNQRPVIFGDGNQTRDFIFINDVVRANLQAIRSRFSEGESFNIASGKSISILRLLATINRIVGKSIKPVFKEGRVGDIRYSAANINRAKNNLRWLPRESFFSGMEKTIQWFHDYDQKRF